MQGTQRISIHVPGIGRATQARQEEMIKNAIAENEGKFFDLLHGLSEINDGRAAYMEGSFEVTDVDILGQSAEVYVEFEWESNYGCKDMDSGDVETETWEFTIETDVIIFDYLPPTLSRNREDEI